MLECGLLNLWERVVCSRWAALVGGPRTLGYCPRSDYCGHCGQSTNSDSLDGQLWQEIHGPLVTTRGLITVVSLQTLTR
ncbi:hypothetical protein RRG08_008558 [Elysia crispata]|uniref:Uncharacterized protein n=1 Tax=Elysia crispata TaxID=231223 RepID=A0AAE0YNL2_9GAST|nr:hypothetical protein RRG08_008558 [Elysia crispata]